MAGSTRVPAMYAASGGTYAAEWVDFDFGLGADFFTFVSPDHFCDHHPRRFAVDAVHVREVYTRTAVINHFDSHDRVFVNAGISVDRVRTHDNRPIKVVRVAALPNATREGWRGAVDSHPARTVTPGNNNAGRNFGNGNNQANHEPLNRATGSPYVAPHPQPVENQGNRNPELQKDSRPVIQQKQEQQQFQQRLQPVQPEPRIEKPVETERPAPQVQQRVEKPVEQRIEPRQEQRVEPQVEPRESHAEQSAPRNQPPAAAPAQNEQHNSDKDKNNH